MGNWELELYVDVDGRRPMTTVSGDFAVCPEALLVILALLL